jgi:hypothetical protein
MRNGKKIHYQPEREIPVSDYCPQVIEKKKSNWYMGEKKYPEPCFFPE